MFRTAQSLLFAGLLTGLALTTQAQDKPTKNLPPDHYYVDGKPSTKEEVEALAKKKAIKRMDVFTGQQAVDYSHDPASKKVALATTK